MARSHATPDGPVPFTPEEEVEWDAVAATADERLQETQAAEIRQQRNAKLTECDWTQLPDAPVDAGTWVTYRQDLRDVTKQQGFPTDVSWPVPPTAA